MSDSDDLRWHQALAYAVTGRLLDGLGRQDRPDTTALAAILSQRLAAGDLDLVADPSVQIVPPELRTGLGPAQFGAALAVLRAALHTDGRVPTAPTPDRPLTADERRLLDDVPPHHGV